jgi:hypothetical protein
MSAVLQPPFDNREPSDSRSSCPAFNALANHISAKQFCFYNTREFSSHSLIIGLGTMLSSASPVVPIGNIYVAQAISVSQHDDFYHEP